VIIPLPKEPPTKLERFARGLFAPSIRLVQKYAPSMARLEWEYPRLDRFIRAMRAKGYTEDQVKEGVRLLIDRTAEKIAKRKGLEVEQVRPVLEEVLKRPTGAEKVGREVFRFGLLSAAAVPTGGLPLPLAAATEGALFAGLETLGKVALGERITPGGMAESFALGAVFPPILRGAGKLWRAIRGVRKPPVTAAEEIETLAKRLEEVGEKFTKRIETPEDYDDFLSAITEVFPTEAPERAIVEVAEVARLVPKPKVLAEEAPERVLEELEVITGGIPRAPVREVALPKPPVEEIAKKTYEGLKPGTAEWMRVWREHPELQREMLEYRRQFVPEEMAPPKPKAAPPEVPREPKVEVPKVGEKGPKEVPKPPVEKELPKPKPPAKKAKAEEHPWIKTVKEEFGITFNIREAGFLLPDGELLDFSGRKWGMGKVGGQRLLDHTEIGNVIGKGGREGVYDFMKETGAARMAAYGDELDINIVRPLTEKQIRTILRHGRGRNVFVEVTDPTTKKILYSKSLEPALPGELRRTLEEANKVASVREVPKPPVKEVPKPIEAVGEAGWQPVKSYSHLKPGDYIRVHYRGKVYEGRIAGKPKRMRSGAVMVPLEGGNRKWAPWTPKAKYERKVE